MLRQPAHMRVRPFLACHRAKALAQPVRQLSILPTNGLSIVEGPSEPPLDTRTLPQYFSEAILGKHAARPALVCPRERPRTHGGPVSRNMGIDAGRNGYLAWDFAEFDDNVAALARGLVGLGVKKNDRVAVVMGNLSAYAMLQWACAKIGAILVTINPAYRAQELISTLRLVGVSHLFLVPRIRTSSYLDILTEVLPSLRTSSPGDIQEESLPDLKHIVLVDNTGEPASFQRMMNDVHCLADFREILVWRGQGMEENIVTEMQASLNKDDVMNMQFTSGTTGMPKAVSLTHYNLLNNGISIGAAMELTDNDVLCNAPPLFHCFGLVLGNLAAWTHGACIVYPSEIFHPPSIVDAVTKLRCTALHGVPTHFLGVLKEVEMRRQQGETLDFSHLRTGIAAGSPVPIELMNQLISKLNLNGLTIAYGMTETSPVSFQTTATDPLIKRVETVGRVRPHVRAKVVDVEGNIVPVGTPGELYVAGYLVQKGYWGNDAETEKVMKEDPEDGHLYMHTGDEAVLDEEGYLSIVGRIKDIIIRGGENLFPVQIENVLTNHPFILEAAAVSVPHPALGEVVGAWIVLKDGAKMTREEVRKVVWEGMNPQNAPAWVWFVGEDGTPGELPKTASGKVQKHILRDWSKTLAKDGIGLTQT